MVCAVIKIMILIFIDRHGKIFNIEHVRETSLVVQWLKIRLAMQGTWVGSLVLEDPTRCRTTRPMSQTTEPHTLEPVLCNKRSHCNETPAQCSYRKPA